MEWNYLLLSKLELITEQEDRYRSMPDIFYNASFFCETASQHHQEAFLSSIFVSKDSFVYSIYMHIAHKRMDRDLQ